MRKVIPKNIADEMTKPYIDDAVEKQIKAADVPPRNKLNISFENASRIDDDKEYKSNQEAYEKNHGKLYDMTHKNTIPWRNYVVYLVLLSLLTCVFTFSKYMSSATGASSAVVASFKVDCTDNITATVKMDDNKTYPLVNFDAVYDLVAKEYKFTATNESDVDVYLTWTISGADNATIKLERITADDKDASETQLYLPAATTQGGDIVPSTRELKLSVKPKSTENKKEYLNVNFTFDQID